MSDSAHVSPAPSVLANLKQSLTQSGTDGSDQGAAPAAQSGIITPAPGNDDALNAFASAVPQAIDTATNTLNPAGVAGSSRATAKEVAAPAVSLERPQVDALAGMQVVEVEPSAELPPEVDGYLKEVGHREELLPQEVVINDPNALHQPTPYLAQPVVVLPITPEVEKQGAHQPVLFSVRWLVEWSRRIMKVFSGKVIYRELKTS